ncbi:hypothetical protein [Marinifilum sp.]|uniref:hypothetical protein n=1 Tax=Marinifilum sp. TaxID=2033137 RepID=UPI003BAAE521
MKEFNENAIESTAEYRSAIVQEILEFYRIQPGVSELHIEKLEEYLLLMNSLLVEAMQDLLSLLGGDVNMEDTIDVLNSYIISVVEESYKVFPKEDLKILPFNQFDNSNEIQILEYLRNLNQEKSNRFDLDEMLIELDENLYENDFPDQLHKVIEKTILAINSEMILKVEDLLK